MLDTHRNDVGELIGRIITFITLPVRHLPDARSRRPRCVSGNDPSNACHLSACRGGASSRFCLPLPGITTSVRKHHWLQSGTDCSTFALTHFLCSPPTVESITRTVTNERTTTEMFGLTLTLSRCEKKNKKTSACFILRPIKSSHADYFGLPTYHGKTPPIRPLIRLYYHSADAEQMCDRIRTSCADHPHCKCVLSWRSPSPPKKAKINPCNQLL